MQLAMVMDLLAVKPEEKARAEWPTTESPVQTY